MSSELVTLRKRASIKGSFSGCGQYYPTAEGNSDAPETRSIVFLPFTKPARAYAGRPLIKPLVPGALNLKTLAHNGRYCQLLFLLLILGDKKGVRI